MPKEPSSKLPVISLFSGGMGFDLGLEEAGLDVRACVEWEAKCCATIRANRPDIAVLEGDIREKPTAEILKAARLREGQPFAVVGGPPCQSFSTGGKRGSILDARGSLFMEFIRVVREARPKTFVFENVGQLVTAPIQHRPIADRPGQNWNLAAYSRKKADGTPVLFDSGDAAPLTSDEMSGSAVSVVLNEFDKLGYDLDLGILNSANYGVPQRRLRLVIIGSRLKSQVRVPRPTHSLSGENGLPKWRSLADALNGLKDENPMHSSYGEEFTEVFRLVPPGGNWRALPEAVARRALGKAYFAGGGKTGFFRRLSWDEPTPTIVGKPNRKSSAICHPEHIRPLTVRESARVQGFPDNWQFVGSMHDQYLQIGNAVPVGLGRAVGLELIEMERESGGKVYPKDSAALHAWKSRREQMLEAARTVLKNAARNKRGGQNRSESSSDVEADELLLA